jgi:hypothetical protein
VSNLRGKQRSPDRSSVTASAATARSCPNKSTIQTSVIGLLSYRNLNKAKNWEDRAAKMRALSGEMGDPVPWVITVVPCGFLTTSTRGSSCLASASTMIVPSPGVGYTAFVSAHEGFLRSMIGELPRLLL